jgi:hypothetical protein
MIRAYMKNTGGTGQNVTLYLAVMPNDPSIASSAQTVPANSEGWVYFWFFQKWNYDTLFCWFEGMPSGVSLAYTQDNPPDGWRWDGSKFIPVMSWESEVPKQPMVDFDCLIGSVGTLPVSGTLNTIEVPVSSVGSTSGYVQVPATGTATLINIQTPGENLVLECWSDLSTLAFRIDCDGIMLQFKGDVYFNAYGMYGNGYTASTPFISLLKYNATAGQPNVFLITFPFKWKRQLVISAVNPDSAARNALATINYVKLAG